MIARPVYVLLAMSCAALLAACTPTAKTPGTPISNEDPTTAPQTPIDQKPSAALRTDIRIGLLLPLSGSYSDVGQALLNAASLAIFDAGDSRLILIPRDTGGTPEGAAAAATALLAEGVDIIAGPLLAGEVRTVGPLAKDQDIKIIGFSTDRSVAGDGIYLLSFTPEDEVRRITRFAIRKGHTRFAALVPQTAYGETVSRAFTTTLTEADATLADRVTYTPDTAKLMEPAKRIAHYDERKRDLDQERAFLRSLGEDDLAAELLARLANRDTIGPAPYDAILLPEGAALLRVIAPLLPYYDVDPKHVQFLGTGLWNDPSLSREPQLLGGWFATPAQDRAQAFMDRYRTTFRAAPPRIATLAYDAVTLVATMAKMNTNADASPFTSDVFADSKGYSGIDGIFRFREDGTAERGLAILRITRQGFETVSAAPQSFDSDELQTTPTIHHDGAVIEP